MPANSQENDKKYSLKVSLPGLLPPSEDNLLRSGFAYLLRSSLSMVDLYPWLGQLLFRSKAVETDQLDKLTGSTASSVNVVGVFVDDSWDVMRFNLAKALNVEDDVEMVKSHLLDYVRMAAWMDTFGSFGADSSLDKTDPNGWFSQRIPGAGNPMRMFRFVREVYEKESDGKVNVFLLSSLSNLYRNIGLPDTVAFLTAVLNEAIWSQPQDSDRQSREDEQKQQPESVDPSSKDKKEESRQVKNQDGVFVAVLQEGVLGEDEASYVESFFDGIIRFEMNRSCDLQCRKSDDKSPRHGDSKRRESDAQSSRHDVFWLPTFEVQRLPGVTYSRETPERCIYIPANARGIPDTVLKQIRYEPPPNEDKDPNFIRVYKPKRKAGPTANGQTASTKGD